MEIIGYNNHTDVCVRFEDGTIVDHVKYRSFKEQKLVNYNIPSYLGVGYRGYGIYKTREGNVKTKAYIKWGSMLTRCYSEKYIKSQNYINCTVCEEWKNYQNFAKWYYKNEYQLPNNEKLELDKDIKIKGNKIYSPDTCLLLPHILNTIFLDGKNDRGLYKIGVTKTKNNKYTASCMNENGENKYIGIYSTEQEAYNAYITKKKEIVDNVVDKYKTFLPKDVYEAVKNYKII